MTFSPRVRLVANIVRWSAAGVFALVVVAAIAGAVWLKDRAVSSNIRSTPPNADVVAAQAGEVIPHRTTEVSGAATGGALVAIFAWIVFTSPVTIPILLMLILIALLFRR